MICTTCNRPAEAPYRNEAAGEGCVDSVHDAFLPADELGDVQATRQIIAEMGVNLDVVFAEARERAAAGLEADLDGAGIGFGFEADGRKADRLLGPGFHLKSAEAGGLELRPRS